ncbi:MAG TPA: hypothetical protein VGW74_06965 [Propionibacteriaceae bacterium]|nr:hypothetical protein [Propionibacteriaceae bacterium]
MSGETKEILVRLPVEVHPAVKADADANERSIAGTVRLAVRQYVARQAAANGGEPS